ncbi:MAG: hypothetical protein HN916_15670 [Anaerolineae bacterium]|jgi:hypothetical protein|nr:hypothetical protein [Anaerolineae bacterium]
MKIRKIISTILLVVFLITLPVSLLAFNASTQLLSEENLPEILMESTLSNKALPQRVREAVWYQSWYGEGLDDGPRMLITGIHNQQIVKLFGMVLPESDREALVTDIAEGLFGWLGNDAPYPDVVIESGAIIENVKTNAADIGYWVHESIKVPPCNEEIETNIANGVFSEDMMNVISCNPSNANHQAVGNHLGEIITGMVATAPVPESIDVGAQLSANMDEESALATKDQLNRVRNLTRILWILPILLLVIGLALLGRDRKTLLAWAGWPLFISGLIGIILASRLASPTLILENAFMPPPASMPAPAAPIVMAILGQLLTTVGSALQWQMGIVFALGLGLVLYTNQTALLNFITKAGEKLSKWLMLKPQNTAEKVTK